MIPSSDDIVTDVERRKLDEIKHLGDTESTKADFLRLREIAYSDELRCNVFDHHITHWNTYEYSKQTLLIKTAILWLLHQKVRPIKLRPYAEEYLTNDICKMWHINLKDIFYLGVSDMEVRKADFTFENLMNVTHIVEDCILRYYQMLLIVVAKRKLKEKITKEFARVSVNIMEGAYEDLQKVIISGCSENYVKFIKNKLCQIDEILRLHKLVHKDVDQVITSLLSIADDILTVFSAKRKQK